MRNLLILGIIATIAISGCITEPAEPDPNWQEEYKQEVTKSIGWNIASTNVLDYYKPEVQALADQLVSQSNSAEDYIKKVREYVYQNIPHNRDTGQCGHIYQAYGKVTASTVLQHGKAICSGRTILGVALLRAGGVMSRGARGCVDWTAECDFFSMINVYFTGPPITEPVWSDNGYIIGSGIHAWGEAYLPNKGWIAVDFSSRIDGIYEYPCLRYDWHSTPNSFKYQEWCFAESNYCEG